MNKKEWKLQHSANRRLYKGLFGNMINGERCPTESENFKLASSMFWGLVETMHPSFYCALQPNRKVTYSIKDKRWAASHNSMCFNQNRYCN